MKTVFMTGLLVMMGICSANADEYVRGYTRSNGTYVAPYFRTDRNETVRNNYTYYGNVNPYHGRVGTNKYSSYPSSAYYRSRY